MPYRRLFIFIEGNDDERFFKNVLLHKFNDKFDSIFLWKYSQQRDEKVKNFIRSINSMGGEYIYIADYNENFICIMNKKQKIKNSIQNINEGKIIIVKKEIESWYLAGLDDNCCRRLRIPILNDTESISKENFNQLKPSKFKSRIEFMQEILKYFSLDIAKEKNGSFNYFVEKYDC